VKSGQLFLMMLGCISLLPGAVHARLHGTASQQQKVVQSAASQVRNQGEARTPDGEKRRKDESLAGQKTEHSHAAIKNRLPILSTKTRERSKQLPNTQKQFPSKGAFNSQQPFSDKSGGSAKTGIIQQQTAKSAASRRTPTARVPSLGNVRHRGANPAVIGGSAHANSRNTSAISGTTVHRRP
jgi:hypothetical protein